MTNRRVFLATAATLAATPWVAAMPEKPQADDPVLALIETEVGKIYESVQNGDRSAANIRALEQIMRFQALHVKTHYDERIKQGLKQKVAEAGSRGLLVTQMLSQSRPGHMEAEVRKRFPKYTAPGRTLPAHADLERALEEIERDGLSARFVARADALKLMSERAVEGRLVRASVAPGQWYNPCSWWASANELDNALLQAWCGLSFFGGYGMQAICALWAIENGISNAFEWLFCAP